MSKPEDFKKIDELIVAHKIILTTIQVASESEKDLKNYRDEELNMFDNAMNLERILHDSFPKMLLLSIASNFEYRVDKILNDVLSNNCLGSFFFIKLINQHILGSRNFSKIINIPNKKETNFYNAINIVDDEIDDDDVEKIHTTIRNAIIVSKHIFSNISGFHYFIYGKIKNDSDFGKNVIAFATIIARRNLLIHNNLLYYDKNKIGTDDVVKLYQRGNNFINNFHQIIDQFQEVITLIKNSDKHEIDILPNTIKQKYNIDINKDWIDKLRYFY